MWFPHLAGQNRPGGIHFCPRVVGVVDTWKHIWSGDGTLTSPGATGPRRSPGRQFSPRAGSIQPTKNQPVGLRFPHLAGRYRPGGTPFLSSGCWSCRCTEGFIIGAWIPSPGAAVSMSLSQSVIRRWGWSFHTVRDGVDPRNRYFSPRLAGDIWRDF